MNLSSAAPRARWDDPPDFDGDLQPDPLVAIEYRAPVTCRALASDHPCPPLFAPSRDRASTSLAFVGMFTGDRFDADAGTPTTGRLLGTRRVALAEGAGLRARATGVEFSEFGPALVVRTLVETAEAETLADVDAVDVLYGLGLDRLAGTVIHHCVHRDARRRARVGAIAIAAPSLAPLVWRAATSHPYTGCATDAEALDAALGATLLGGVRIGAITTSPAPPQPRVMISLDGAAPRAVARRDRGPATPGDPLALGPVRVLEMARACQWDEVRYERDGRRCTARITRHDDPLPGCEERPSPLDPDAPRPLWLSPHLGTILDGGVPTEPLHLTFLRGGARFEAALPLACRGEHRTPATPWQGTAPPAVAVSPDGTRALYGTGDDLWLYTPTRRVPYLLDPPGGPLPRHEVRAAAFVDARRVAVVLSSQLYVFDVDVPATDVEVPASLELDLEEYRRGLRGR